MIVTDPAEARIAEHDGFILKELAPGLWSIGPGYREARRRATFAYATVWRKCGPRMGNVLTRQEVLRLSVKRSRSHTRAKPRTHRPTPR